MSATEIITTVISITALVISLLTYLGSTARVQLKKKQAAAMRVLAVGAISVFDRLQTLAYAQRHQDVTLDRYQLIAMKVESAALREQLDHAVGRGLLKEIVTDRDYALQLFTSFTAGLDYQATLDLDDPLSEWTKVHLIYGVTRLLDILLDWEGTVIPDSIRGSIESSVYGLREEAWNYLRPHA